MEHMLLPQGYDYLAPDGSEIRLLPTTPMGGLAHCTLGPGKTSAPKVHVKVEEIWFFLNGEGEVWRKYGSAASLTPVSAGTAITIPYQTHYQFRNTGKGLLQFVIVTLPAWPGRKKQKTAKEIRSGNS
jgi:mannose-6-phosphate isomerase-like protein (cupin superfamily)